MSSIRKFFKTVVTIEILSEERLPDPLSLEEINYLITEGPCSGKMTHAEREISAKVAARELCKQESDPEFFRLDKLGNDLPED